MDESKKLDLDYRFEFYLKQIKVNPAQVPPKVLREIKIAFFSGMASIFVILTDAPEIDDDDKIIKTLKRVNKQLIKFFKNIVNPETK